MLLDLFPVMCADLRLLDSTRVYANDASKLGGSIVR